MIDFRYHLVSLISVFLALAVGIALGAGPLKETIGDTLTGQVDQLRTEKDDLSAELAVTRADLARSQESIDAVAPALLEGILAERRIAVITLGEADDAAVEQVRERLDQAGAVVTATVRVTEDWTDLARASYRQQLAGTLVEYLDPAPAASAGAGTELAESLAQALTDELPTDPDVRSDDAGLVLDLLVDSGLVEVDGDVTLPADAIVVVAGPTVSVQEVQDAAAEEESQAPEDVAAEEEQREAVHEAAAQIAAAAQARSTGAVVAGGDYAEPSVLERVRQDAGGGPQVSTVEAVHTLSGQVAVPLALSARIAGTVGHFGTSPDATAPMPPHVVLPPVERVPEEPVADAGEPADPDAPSDGSTGEDAGESTGADTEADADAGATVDEG